MAQGLLDVLHELQHFLFFGFGSALSWFIAREAGAFENESLRMANTHMFRGELQEGRVQEVSLLYPVFHLFFQTNQLAPFHMSHLDSWLHNLGRNLSTATVIIVIYHSAELLFG